MKRSFLFLLVIIMLSLPLSALASDMPGIKGSQAYDLILSLKDNGFNKPETQQIDGGFYWQSDNIWFGESMAIYSITANSAHEVAYATFTMLPKDKVGFLQFCATMPFDASDTSKSTAFVKDHLSDKDGEESTLQVGDALFTLSPNGKGGAILRIEAVGYEDWCLESIIG